MKKRLGKGLLALSMLGIFSWGCYGPFKLVQQVHHFNGNIGGKWVNEICYFVFGGIVYPIAGFGDALIFNSIEFWGGNNPISSPYGETDNKQDK